MPESLNACCIDGPPKNEGRRTKESYIPKNIATCMLKFHDQLSAKGFHLDSMRAQKIPLRRQRTGGDTRAAAVGFSFYPALEGAHKKGITHQSLHEIYVDSFFRETLAMPDRPSLSVDIKFPQSLNEPHKMGGSGIQHAG